MPVRWDVGQRFLGEEAGDFEPDESLKRTFYQLRAEMEEKEGAFMPLLDEGQLCRSPRLMRRLGPGLRDLGTGADGNTNEGNAAVLAIVLTSGCGSHQLLRILYTEIREVIRDIY